MIVTSQTSIGTGGTISGVGQFLKSVNEDVRVVLADPEGSGLYNKVSSKVCTNLDRIRSHHHRVLPSVFCRSLIAGKSYATGFRSESDGTFSFLSYPFLCIPDRCFLTHRPPRLNKRTAPYFSFGSWFAISLPIYQILLPRFSSRC